MLRQLLLKERNERMEEITEKQKELYEAQVKKRTPVRKLLPQMAKAFLVGGSICLLGQIIINICISEFGMDKEIAGAWCSVILVLTSVILTGMNVYPKLVDFGGCGALVPITGFANSVTAPCIEYKKEGQVYGIGCKIFTIAGPVILYGIVTSFLLGILYLICKMM